jgi:hypothetical protein
VCGYVGAVFCIKSDTATQEQRLVDCLRKNTHANVIWKQQRESSIYVTQKESERKSW